jgi:hypothetical protein
MRRAVYILLILVTAFGCKKPYAPKAITSTSSYLVVEGVINTGADSTVVKLSRTVALSSSASLKPESNAIVTIMSDAGSSYTMVETGGGHYRAPGFNATIVANYRLKIATAEGEAYQSDYVPAKTSPPIDSVYYRVKGDGVQIYADTHDPGNNTRYYRWDYNETYQYRSAFESYYYHARVPQDTIIGRQTADHIFVCYRGDISSNIIVNTSARLVKDVIAQTNITFIPSTLEKIESRYSILVRQYALTPDAFNYFQQLKKNTEQLGSVFDAQPSELPGNIHCLTNPAEPVLGYITAGAPAEARIFIDNRDLPAWRANTPYNGCKMDTDLYAKVLRPGVFENDVAIYLYPDIEIPIYAIVPPIGFPILGFSASSAACVDCTLRGTSKRPDFWQDAEPGSVY